MGLVLPRRTALRRRRAILQAGVIALALSTPAYGQSKPNADRLIERLQEAEAGSKARFGECILKENAGQAAAIVAKTAATVQIPAHCRAISSDHATNIENLNSAVEKHLELKLWRCLLSDKPTYKYFRDLNAEFDSSDVVQSLENETGILFRGRFDSFTSWYFKKHPVPDKVVASAVKCGANNLPPTASGGPPVPPDGRIRIMVLFDGIVSSNLSSYWRK